MDARTCVFLVLTLSVCVNAFACALATLPIPGLRDARAALGLFSFRAALVSALLGFLYRIAYSMKRPPSYTLAGFKAVIDPIVDSNGFQLSAYALASLLRRRCGCADNTVFRIKYTYYDAGYYHRQFWSMLDEKTAPAIAKVPPLAALVRAAKARLGTTSARKSKAT